MPTRVLSGVLGLVLVAALSAAPAQAQSADASAPADLTLSDGERPAFKAQLMRGRLPQQVEDEPIAPSGGLRPGVALVLGTDLDVGVRGEFYVPLPIEVSGDVAEYIRRLEVGGDVELYLPDDFFSVTYRYFVLNFNVRSVVYTLNPVFFYALAGVNYTRITLDFDNIDNTSDNNVGVNGGVGVEYPLDLGDIFAEFKLTVGGVTQWVSAAGIRFSLGG